MKQILFNTEMVQAILDGKKTVTRRICKDANEYTVPLNGYIDNGKRTYAIQGFCDTEHTNSVSIAEAKMPICADDVLWVRETFSFQGCETCQAACLSCRPDCYKNEEGCFVYRTNYGSTEDDTFPPAMYKWKPSIHMPKDAARIFLKVTNVKVERLQDMNGLDVLKEGVNSLVHPNAHYFNGNQLEMFARLWNRTVNKKEIDRYGWDVNPWVWAIEFEKLDTNNY